MAKSFPAALLTLLAFAAALFAAACSGGEEGPAVSNPGTEVPQGLSVTLYASPT